MDPRVIGGEKDARYYRELAERLEKVRPHGKERSIFNTWGQAGSIEDEHAELLRIWRGLPEARRVVKEYIGVERWERAKEFVRDSVIKPEVCRTDYDYTQGNYRKGCRLSLSGKHPKEDGYAFIELFECKVAGVCVLYIDMLNMYIASYDLYVLFDVGFVGRKLSRSQWPLYVRCYEKVVEMQKWVVLERLGVLEDMQRIVMKFVERVD
jgi:hypothetical protein